MVCPQGARQENFTNQYHLCSRLSQSRSQSIVWLLEELKVPYELKIYHRDRETKLAPPELQKVHPLGKSPVVTILPPGATEPIVLAESGFMIQYLVDHFPEGQRLAPKKWKDGMENKIGGETDEWMRYEYFLHYTEGSLMPIMVMSFVLGSKSWPAKPRSSLPRILTFTTLVMRSPQIPFFIRPITSMVVNRIFGSFIFPNAQKHLALIDQYLAASGGTYLCCDKLTAADILMSFPLIVAQNRLNDMGQWEGGSWKAQFPRVYEYLQRLESEEGYKRSQQKIESVDGKFSASL